MDCAGHSVSASVVGAVHTSLVGWDWLCALLLVVVAVVLEQTGTIPRAVAIVTLFGVSLLAFAVLVSW